MADPIKRLNYFNGQFLREPDFNDEQAYHLRNQRDHARLLHTAGIAEGLGVPDPAAGASAVTVNAGTAYDGLGRRIVLPDNKLVELAALAPGVDVIITIAYDESQTDPTDETGLSGNRRWTESPLVETWTDPSTVPDLKLVLARVSRAGTVVTAIDRSARAIAGAKGGDLGVNSLTLSSDAVAPIGWVSAQLASSGVAGLKGSLKVNGNLVVTGLITGNIAANTIETGDLIDAAVTLPKLAPNSVDASKIVDGAESTAELANGSVTLQKLAPALVPYVSNSARYSISSALNTTSVTAPATFVRLDNYLQFTKTANESVIEVHLHSRAVAGVFSGANGVIFQIRIDDATTNPLVANDAAITTSGATEQISIFAVFQNLALGQHMVSVWVRANGGTSSGVLLDPGGWGGRIIVKETF